MSNVLLSARGGILVAGREIDLLADSSFAFGIQLCVQWWFVEGIIDYLSEQVEANRVIFGELSCIKFFINLLCHFVCHTVFISINRATTIQRSEIIQWQAERERFVYSKEPCGGSRESFIYTAGRNRTRAISIPASRNSAFNPIMSCKRVFKASRNNQRCRFLSVCTITFFLRHSRFETSMLLIQPSTFILKKWSLIEALKSPIIQTFPWLTNEDESIS